MDQAPRGTSPIAKDPNERYRQLFEESTAAQLVVEAASGRVVEANRAASDSYGVPRQALIGATLEALGGDDPTALQDALEVAAAIGVHLVGLPQRHASGERRLLEVYGTPFGDEGEGLVHLILHDITERARAEQREREFLTRLARQDVVQREVTLARMGELVAGVAHEVRNPLFALSSALDALRQRLGPHPDFARYAPLLTAQVDRLSTLMADLLEYGRPAALSIRNVPVRDLLAATLDVTAAQANDAGVTLTLHDATAPGRTVPVDPFRFVQALQNLVLNAAQYSSRGSHVVLGARERDGEPGVEFSVLDSGPGFDPAVLASVFTPFVTKRPGGTGLGLALVHRTVHDHGGLVFAENSIGHDGRTNGALVRVLIPTPP